MSDDIDQANAIADRLLTRALAVERAPIAAGVPGECDGCERVMPRLVDGLCEHCRDGGRR